MTTEEPSRRKILKKVMVGALATAVGTAALNQFTVKPVSAAGPPNYTSGGASSGDPVILGFLNQANSGAQTSIQQAPAPGGLAGGVFQANCNLQGTDGPAIVGWGNGSGTPGVYASSTTGIGLIAESTGLTTADYAMHARTTRFYIAKFENTATTGDRTALVDITPGSGSTWRCGVSGPGNQAGIPSGTFYIERSGAGAKMVINSSGFVGIGTDSPAAALHIQAAIPIFRFTGTTLPGNQWHFGRFDGSNRFTIAETGVQDWLTILGTNGFTGLGTINPGVKLDVLGTVRCTGFINTSDLRLKEDIEPITNVLDRLEQVRAVRFQWNKDYTPLDPSAKGRQIGLIAQEVEKAFPELVTRADLENIKDARGVDYARFTAVLLEAVKELHKQVTELQSQVRALNGTSPESTERIAS